MSEDLSIQQRRPSVMPYFLTGATLGGAGTALAVTKLDSLKKYVAKSFDDLVQEAKNGDKFTKNLSKTSTMSDKRLLVKFKNAVLNNDDKTLNSCKDDIAKFLEGKFSNKKLALAIGGGAVALGLLFALFRPKAKNN